MSDKKQPSSQTEIINTATAARAPWSWSKKFGFRVLFIFFLAMSIPFSGSWYTNIFTLNWLRPHYRDLYDIARFQPNFRQFFGGQRYGDITDAPAENNAPGGNEKKAGKRHRGDSETTQTADNGGHKGQQHRHKGATKAPLTISKGLTKSYYGDTLAILAAGNENGTKKQHHRDSAGVVLANNNSDGHRHGPHNRDSLATDSSNHGLAKIGGVGNSNDRSGNGNDVLPPERNFLADYTDWGIALLIGIVGALIWTLFDRKRKSYNLLYYCIRVVVRYRAGIGIIGFGFTKLFPTQMPYPSLGLLNSNFGDFTAQKIYWMSVGIVPWYQVFGGVVEIVAGALLFFRKTSLFGAILLVGALGDITFVNYAYDGGVHVYAFYFVLLGLFIAADDFPKLYNLLVLERYTVPYRVYPDFTKPWLKYTRIGLKVLTFVIFFGVLTYTEVINFKYDPYKQPSTAGVKKLRGNYYVTQFKINGHEIPYNPLDSTRWQEATFENWTTLTFKVNRPVLIDPSNGGGSPMRDIQRTFEITGVAGGERAFHYYADTIDRVLYLQDKNAIASRGGGRGGRRGSNANKPDKPKEDNWISKAAWQHIGSEKDMIDKHAWSARRDREFAVKPREQKRNRMVLKYDTTDGSRVILSGINERKDSIYVVLDRYDRKYALPKSTLIAGKYE